MKFDVFNEHLEHYSVSKTFTIETNKGDTLEIYKHLSDGDDMTLESDWDFQDKESKKIYDKMSEEDQDAFYDFVMDLKL